MTTQPYLPTNAGPVEWAGPDSYFYAISGLIHCVRLPKAADLNHPAPAVIMVHGWGGDESAMWLFKHAVPAEAAIITPRAPMSLEGGGYAWYYRDPDTRQPDLEGQTKAAAQFEHFVTSLPDLYPIDPARLLLIGFSQGGAMGNALALTRPELMLGVASIASFIPELTETISLDQPLDRLAVFITHGAQDDIVPVQAAHRARDLYQALQAKVIYHEYNVRHKVSSQGMEELKGWVREALKREV